MWATSVIESIQRKELLWTTGSTAVSSSSSAAAGGNRFCARRHLDLRDACNGTYGTVYTACRQRGTGTRAYQRSWTRVGEEGPGMGKVTGEGGMIAWGALHLPLCGGRMPGDAPQSAARTNANTRAKSPNLPRIYGSIPNKRTSSFSQDRLRPDYDHAPPVQIFPCLAGKFPSTRNM